MFVRVIGIVYHQWSSEAITVLRREMRVIPISPSLILCIELVQKAFVGLDGTLCNPRNSISPVRIVLEDAMPVLWGFQNQVRMYTKKARTMLVDVFIEVS